MTKCNKKAFSLSELMIATGILSIAVTGLLGLLVSSIILTQTNNNTFIAANDAQYVLEEIKTSLSNGVLTYSSLDSYNPSALGLANLTDETITLDPAVSEVVNGVKEVTVRVEWTERGGSRNFSLSTQITE